MPHQPEPRNHHSAATPKPRHEDQQLTTELRELIRKGEIQDLLLGLLNWDASVTEPLLCHAERAEYQMTPIAAKAGFTIHQCSSHHDGSMPPYHVRQAVHAYAGQSLQNANHITVFTNRRRSQQIWHYYEPAGPDGKTDATHEKRYQHGFTGDSLVQGLREIRFPPTEPEPTLQTVIDRCRKFMSSGIPATPENGKAGNRRPAGYSSGDYLKLALECCQDLKLQLDPTGLVRMSDANFGIIARRSLECAYLAALTAFQETVPQTAEPQSLAELADRLEARTATDAPIPRFDELDQYLPSVNLQVVGRKASLDKPLLVQEVTAAVTRILNLIPAIR